MKIISNITMIFLLTFLLASCDFFNEKHVEQTNLIDRENLTEDKWIGFNGEENDNSNFVYTEQINYNPMNEYTLNRNSYVSFYKDDKFLRTMQHPGGDNVDVESEANKIVVSFNKDRIEDIELFKK